ncbi:MAG: porin family protein [Chitinophagaceae bacterium]
MKYSIYLITGLLFTNTALLHAQPDTSQKTFTPYFESRLVAGFNLGATAPLGFPNTIRKIHSFWPKFCPAFGYELTYMFNPKWGAGTGIKVEFKGMGTEDQVLYFPTIIVVNDGANTGTFTGTFSGKNKTVVNNSYLTFPVIAVFRPNDKWRFNAGFYFAWLINPEFYGTVSDGYIRNGGPTGERVDIDEASFDFDTEVRKFDWGFRGGAARAVGKRISINADLSWGVRPLFPKDFKGLDFPLYNIFAALGIAYQLKP